MANLIRNFIDSLHLSDDDDTDDEYEEYLMETSEKERQREEKRSDRGRRFAQEDEDEEPDYRQNTSNFADLKRERSTRAEKEKPQPSKKVVPFRGSGSFGSSMGIEVMKPTSFEDSQDICDVLLAGKSTIINLEGFNVESAQRVMDFVSGAVYAANGKLRQISKYIFIISPESVDITGDYLDIIRQSSYDFEVPTLGKS